MYVASAETNNEKNGCFPCHLAVSPDLSYCIIYFFDSLVVVDGDLQYSTFIYSDTEKEETARSVYNDKLKFKTEMKLIN